MVEATLENHAGLYFTSFGRKSDHIKKFRIYNWRTSSNGKEIHENVVEVLPEHMLMWDGDLISSKEIDKDYFLNTWPISHDFLLILKSIIFHFCI